MRTFIENLAPLPRKRWVRCAYPREAVADWNFECAFVGGGRRFRAVRGHDVGEMSTIYRIETLLDGSERQDGVLVNEALEGVPDHFNPHPWCNDDVRDLVPRIAIIADGAAIETRVQMVELVEESPAHQRFRLWCTGDRGFLLEWYLETNHLDPVIDCWGRLVWSDRTDRSESIHVDGITLISGELYYDYFDKRKGMGQPSRIGGDWWLPVSYERGLVDGSHLDFYGQMLCTTNELPIGEQPGWVDLSLQDLYAAGAKMPVVACCTEGWDGNWLASRYVPRVQDEDWLRTQEGSEWYQFSQSLQQRGDFYDERPHGLRPQAGSTGDQEDFGATKGTYALVLGEPRSLHMLTYAVHAQGYRPGTCLLEADFSAVDPETRRDWKTWNGYTHFNQGVSPDRLGKNTVYNGTGATGWSGMDDQHRSQNNLAAVLALTGDPLAAALIRTQSIPDLAMLKSRVGAARAVGRLLGCWANFLTVLGEGTAKERFEFLVDEKVAAVLQRAPAFTQPGPVKVLSTIPPDGRKQVYDPATGELAPSWSCWEHGLAAVGLVGAANVLSQQAGDVLRTICETVVRYGLFEQDGQWFLCDDVRWIDGGQPLDDSAYRTDSNQIVVTPGIGGTTGWAFCAVLLGMEWLSGEVQARAQQAVQFFTGGEEAADRRTAEWWACIQKLKQ